MLSYIRKSIRAFAAPQHELAIGRLVWRDLIRDLAARGDGERESGAFLLGHKDGQRREAFDYLLYDDLEPGCLDGGFVQMSSIGFRRLGAEARARGLEVVADIHTHPGRAFFSDTDRENPMVPNVGHLAIVVPNFARGNPDPLKCAFFRFAGGYNWDELPTTGRDTKLYVGFWS